MELLHLGGDAIDDIIVDVLQIDKHPVTVLCVFHIGIPEQPENVPMFLPAQALGLPDQVVSAVHGSQSGYPICMPLRLYDALCSQGLM